MDIYEALDACRSVPPLWTRESTPGEIEAAKHAHRRRVEAENVIDSPETYRHMTAQKGHDVALAALSFFDELGEEGDKHYISHTILAQLAKIVPGSLHGLYQHLIDRVLYWADGVTFREADTAIRDSLLVLLAESETSSREQGDLLCALAWIEDDVVHRLFSHWRHHPPFWPTPPHFASETFTRYAGWEFAPDGTRRFLYHPTCVQLVPADSLPGNERSDALRVFTPSDERCQWCGRPLVALFDCNLHDPRLAFLDQQRDRLCILLCVNCSLQGEHLFTSLDAHGHVRWNEASGDLPTYLDPDLYGGFEDDMPRAKRQLILGPPRTTPYETIALYWQPGLSQIGGHPSWVQYPEYPRCPGCRQSMVCVGQLEITDMQPGVEGMIYAFCCTECGIATTGYQQT